jgi:hypothetical protein
MAAKVRTADEHPLKSGDLKIFRKLFSDVRTETTWFFPLLIFVKFYFIDRVKPDTERYWKKIIVEHKKLSGMYRVLEWMDGIFFRIFPFMRRFCWNIVIFGIK